jgi:PAS domain-containing protein
MRKQKSLVLILARELATNLATPIYIADADGDLVYFNEPAEEIASGRFAERGETSINDWVKMLAPETIDGKPLAREELPSDGPPTGRCESRASTARGTRSRRRRCRSSARTASSTASWPSSGN